jgi:hypothetical protein
LQDPSQRTLPDCATLIMHAAFRLPAPHPSDSRQRRLTVAAAAHARLAESYAPCTRSLPSAFAARPHSSTRHERAPETRHDTTVAAGRCTPTDPLPQSSCSRHVRVPRQVPPGPRARKGLDCIRLTLVLSSCINRRFRRPPVRPSATGPQRTSGFYVGIEGLYHTSRTRHRTLPTDNLTYMRVLAQNDPLEYRRAESVVYS